MTLDLNIDQIFSFKELPNESKKDFLLQFENDFEFEFEEYSFKLKLIPYQQLTKELDDIFGCNLIDELEDDYVVELANDILLNGLINPPIGSEGIHRTLAHHYLNKDMLRFEIIHNNSSSISWQTKQIGIPIVPQYTPLILNTNYSKFWCKR
jgi:hypothetical protein